MAALVHNGGATDHTLAPNNNFWVQFARYTAPMLALPTSIVTTHVSTRSEPAKVLDIAAGHGLFGIALHNRPAEKSLSRIRRSPEKNTRKCRDIGSVLNKLPFGSLAMQRFDSQNVNVSSSAIMMTGGPPDEIFTALAKVCLPPADSAHFWSASMDGKCTSATR